jgi:hypothetical protein
MEGVGGGLQKSSKNILWFQFHILEGKLEKNLTLVSKGHECDPLAL